MPDFNVLVSYIMCYFSLGTQYSGPLIPSHELGMWRYTPGHRRIHSQSLLQNMDTLVPWNPRFLGTLLQCMDIPFHGFSVGRHRFAWPPLFPMDNFVVRCSHGSPCFPWLLLYPMATLCFTWLPLFHMATLCAHCLRIGWPAVWGWPAGASCLRLGWPAVWG